jgi:hypothetical protein
VEIIVLGLERDTFPITFIAAMIRWDRSRIGNGKSTKPFFDFWNGSRRILRAFCNIARLQYSVQLMLRFDAAKDAGRVDGQFSILVSFLAAPEDIER